MNDRHFNASTVALLSAVTGLSEALLHQVRILPRRSNWAHAPWYAASEGGGAMVIGDRIYVTARHEPERIGGDPERLLHWTLLMAHEVMHVGQAQRFGFDGLGRFRFLAWALGNYARSFLSHGRKAHANAPFEREAELGRQRLRQLLEATGGCTPQHPVIPLLLSDDGTEVLRWLDRNRIALSEAKKDGTGVPQRTTKRELHSAGPPRNFAE
ncbi:MAG: hypothetical protein ABI432_13310 [Flavobacteriales bacterium]